jgi:hypothetical protein
MSSDNEVFLQRFGQNIADVLHSNEDHYKEIFIHTFSVGAGMWGVAQQMMLKVRRKKRKITF